MKKVIIIVILCVCFLFGCQVEQKKINFQLGIDTIDAYLDYFDNKNVGLITNPTGINSNYVSTIDVLFEKVNLVSLYAPEHGIRGNSQAGGTVGNEIDVKTGLTVYSLYGQNKKPTNEMLEGIDVLCIDIQDVGARFYTYIYTMAYAMEACQENNIEFVVFDRPNPVSGSIVNGNILDEKYSSFVGMYPIITRHGMTIGEIAKLFNEEYQIGCNLKVITMKDYDRELFYDDYDIAFVAPSPNIPTVDTAIVYSGTCIFEGTNLSQGRGTTKPFEYIGAPFIDPYTWVEKLNALELDGVVFRPIYFTPTANTYANKLCGGVQVHVTNRKTFNSVKVGYAMLYTVKELYPSQVQLTTYINNLSGVDYIYNMEYSLEELFMKIDEDENAFNVTRNKYLLY